MPLYQRFPAIIAICFFTLGCRAKQITPPVTPDTAVLDTAAACKADVEKIFLTRRESVKPIPPIKKSKSKQDRVVIDAWYDKIETLLAEPVSLPCMSEAGLDVDSLEDDHTFSPELVNFTYSRAQAPVLSMPYIAVLDAMPVSVVAESVSREPELDAYGRINYKATVVDSLRGDLSGSVEFEFSKQRNAEYFAGGFKTEIEVNPILLALCRRADGVLVAYPSISEPYAGPGGVDFMREQLAQTPDWTKGDACPEPYLSAAP